MSAYLNEDPGGVRTYCMTTASSAFSPHHRIVRGTENVEALTTAIRAEDLADAFAWFEIMFRSLARCPSRNIIRVLLYDPNDVDTRHHQAAIPYQSARLAYVSWEIEIGRDWYKSQIGRDLWAKVKMFTPVHGISGFLAIEQAQSPCAGVHNFIFAPTISSNLALVPISSNFDCPA